MLNKQIHIYSVDTGAFYTKKEKRLHWKLYTLKKEKNNLISKFNKIKNKDELIYEKFIEIKKYKNKLIKENKNKLLKKLSDSVDYNHISNKNKKIRKLSNEHIVDNNIISVFDSSLTRMLKISENQLSTDIMVVKVYYFDIIKDLIHNGYIYNGEKYKFLTASAGQIRTKKTVFIKQSLWEQYEKTLMCGLTVDLINQNGGINVNKYLAYLSLSNSATDLWEDFDIRKCIVVDDFETEISGMVDFIDEQTYSVERKLMDVPIAHTDGCGLILNSKKNFMIRLPWIKGLLASFDFKDFINSVPNASPVIKDIYGKEHDIIKEDIQIIFTKSQFKMYKYYDDWNDYVDKFIKYNCQAGICNLEEDRIKNAKINYQMLQTLNNMTEDELRKVSKTSIDKIKNLSTTVKSMLEVFGVTKYNQNKTYLQKSLELYPELLNDIYTKEIGRAHV